MSNALPIEDLSKTYLEHSMVINNFVIKIGSQIKERSIQQNPKYVTERRRFGKFTSHADTPAMQTS